MPEDATPGFGAYLREARERARLSVREIAATTKISVLSLEALERDDVARLPGGIFVRSFVRAYAKEVGLDPEDTVRRFVACFPDASAEESPAPFEANPEKIIVDEQPATNRIWRVVGWSLPIVLVIVYFGFGGRLAWWGQSSQPVAPRTEQQAEPAPSTSAPVLTTPAPAPAEASPPSRAAGATEGRFQMTLTSRGRCWVTVRSDGRIVFTGTMNTGDRQDLTLAGNVSLTVGNAGVMDVAINGRPARPLGGEGQVVTARLNIENLNTFLVSR